MMLKFQKAEHKATVRISGQLFNSRQPCDLSNSSLVDGLLQVRFCSSTLT